jgi:hypothetical protein
MSNPSCVHVESVIDCPFSLALGEADGLIRSTLERGTGARVAGIAWRHVTVRSTHERDHTDMGRSHDEIAFSWDARSRWLPNLRGHLRFRPNGVATRMMLDAKYEPPFGTLGSVFDRFVGRRVATATCHDLLHQIGLALEDRWSHTDDFHPERSAS